MSRSAEKLEVYVFHGGETILDEMFVPVVDVLRKFTDGDGADLERRTSRDESSELFEFEETNGRVRQVTWWAGDS